MTHNVRLLSLFFSFFAFNFYAQNVGINATGTPPDASAMLDVSSPNKGLLIPRVLLTGTTDVTTVPTSATSLLVYNTATVTDVTPGYYYWDGSVWTRMLEGGTNDFWKAIGNAGTTVGTNFIGTTDAQDFAIYTNNTEVVRIGQNGNVGIGTTAPTSIVQIGDGSSAGNGIFLSRSTTSPNLGIYESYDGVNDATIQTGMFGYGVRPSDDAWTIWEKGNFSTWTNLLVVTKMGKVGIGTAGPNAIVPNAVLDVRSTTQGFAMPRMTTVQRLAIVSPIDGLQVYDINLKGFYFYNGTNWNCVTTPAGTVDYFANGASPVGYLECNGQSVSTTQYPELFAAIGYSYGGVGAAFNVPDLRGEFIRGMDNGRGVDADVVRAVGSPQKGTLKWVDSGTPSRTVCTINTTIVAGDVVSRQTSGLDKTSEANWPNTDIVFIGAPSFAPVNTAGPTTHNGALGDYGVVGTTRPRNVALLPCIKY